jgi:hypothetical protein
VVHLQLRQPAAAASHAWGGDRYGARPASFFLPSLPLVPTHLHETSAVTHTHICISFGLSLIGLCPVRSCSSVSTTV